MKYKQFGHKRGLRCDKAYKIEEVTGGWFILTIETIKRIGDRIGGSTSVEYPFTTLTDAQIHLSKHY